MWTAFRRTYHDTLLIWKDTMAESILHISLTEDTLVLYSNREKGAELNLREDRSILLICVVLNLLLVAKNNNSTFGTVRIAILVLDCHEAHGRDWFPTFVLDGMIMVKRDRFKDIEVV